MKNYSAAARAYEADLDRRMDEAMDDWDEEEGIEEELPEEEDPEYWRDRDLERRELEDLEGPEEIEHL